MTEKSRQGNTLSLNPDLQRVGPFFLPGDAHIQAQWSSQDSAAGTLGIQESSENAECSLHHRASAHAKYWAGGGTW